MKKRYIAICVIAAAAALCIPLAAGGYAAQEPALPLFLDTNLTFAERAADLVSRLTLEEKISLTANRNEGVPRLGIQPYEFWSEALHGIARQGAATSFPSPLSMASSWNLELMRQIGGAVGDEGRGKLDETQGRYMRLTYWSPTINLLRDPRWGRNEEGYSEDPFLTALMAEQYVSGMQGSGDGVISANGEEYLKLVATLKHYAANNSEYNRHTGSSNMDDRLLRNYYTFAFQHVSQNTNLGSLMTAYNRVNEIPSSAHTYLIDTLLRKTFGFRGFIVSDCWGIEDIYGAHRHNWRPTTAVVPNLPQDWSRPVTGPEAVAFSMMAGTDLSCSNAYPNHLLNALEGNIVTDNGLFTENDLDIALLRIFTGRLQTGEFDPVEDVPYKAITKDVLESEAHHELARRSAREGLILLENRDDFLPLGKNNLNSVAVFGTLAGICELGDYSADLRYMDTLVSFRDGLTELLRDTDISLDFYDGIDLTTVGIIPEWLCNLRHIRFNGADGETLRAVEACELGGRIENEHNSQLGYIKENDWAKFSGVNLVGLNSIEVFTSSDSYPGASDIVIEVRLGSPEGPIIARPMHIHSGEGWNSYEWSLPAPVQVPNDFSIETTPAADLYFVFTCPVNAGLHQDEISRAAAADIAIVYVGTTTEKTIEFYRSRHESDGGRIDVSAFMVCAEFTDRTSLRLPAGQEELINAVLEQNPNTVVIMHTVSTNDIRSFKDKAPAILYSSYNGQFQGQAAAEVIFGYHNPGGRLTTTWYESDRQLPYIGDYDIRGEERTYMFFDGSYCYPFGYGLSYTTFSHGNAGLSKTTVAADGTFTVSVDVTNTGPVKGTDIVQVYLSTPDAGTKGVPQKMLRGFGRVELEPGETKRLDMEINAAGFGMVLEDYGPRVITPGEYIITVARNADDIISTETITVTHTDPGLHTVTLEAGRVTAHSGESFDTALSVALSDETFITAASVVYTSGNENVATVDQNGRVTAVGGGVTTITAAVTYQGDTKESGFPIAVQGGAFTPPADGTDSSVPPEETDTQEPDEPGGGRGPLMVISSIVILAASAVPCVIYLHIKSRRKK
jgi:beta-glucosidase-like glycosyl hydrolase